MDTNENHKRTKDRGKNAKAPNRSKNHLGSRLAHRFWWGWSTELNGSFKT